MNEPPIRLGINIDHVATIRQARGTLYPDVLLAGIECENAGADGITVHLREDRRHIQDEDVLALKADLQIPLNLEMANSPKIVAFACQVRPQEVCLVPEKREELTTEGGLDVAGQLTVLEPSIRRLSDVGIQVSLFIEPDAAQIEAAATLGVPYVELHTGTYANAVGSHIHHERARLITGATQAAQAGLKVNAGHGITLDNLSGVLEMPHLDTLNIGHSIVARALFIGLGPAVREMRTRITDSGTR
jgi:pyridoxine 5-phosphate synthase